MTSLYSRKKKSEILNVILDGSAFPGNNKTKQFYFFQRATIPGKNILLNLILLPEIPAQPDIDEEFERGIEDDCEVGEFHEAVGHVIQSNVTETDVQRKGVGHVEQAVNT